MKSIKSLKSLLKYLNKGLNLLLLLNDGGIKCVIIVNQSIPLSFLDDIKTAALGNAALGKSIVDQPLGKSAVDQPLGKSVVNQPLEKSVVDQLLRKSLGNRPLAQIFIDYILLRSFSFINHSLNHFLVGSLNGEKAIKY